MKKYFLIFAISLLSVSAQSALSPGAVSTATGGSGRAASEPVDSVLLNPAIVSQLPTKFFSVNSTKNQWGITISDNGREAAFPAALAFVRAEQDQLNTQQLSLALAYGYKKLFSVGTTISMLEYNQEATPYDKKYRQTAGDVGLTYSVLPDLTLALVANKVFASASDLEDSLQKQKTTAVGASYTYLNFIRFRFDIESGPDNKAERVVYMGGLETFMNDWVIIRLGYQNNNVLAKNYMTAGIGFSGPQFGLHYAYNSNVATKAEDQHSIDLGIPF